MLQQLIKPSLIFFGITMPLWIGFRYIIAQIYQKKNLPFDVKRERLLFLFYIYIGFVLILTVVPLPMAREKYPGSTRINFIPIITTAKHFIATLINFKTFLRSGSIENVFGNFLLFLPLGFLLPRLWDKYNNWVSVLAIAFILSFSIELIQLASRILELYRSVDIDDIILNTSGAVAGYYLHVKLKSKRK